jgi:hypothetical protein
MIRCLGTWEEPQARPQRPFRESCKSSPNDIRVGPGSYVLSETNGIRFLNNPLLPSVCQTRALMHDLQKERVEV